jgi:hypothetical protein
LALGVLSGCSAPTATRTSTGHVGGAMLTAVYSRADPSYVRAVKPDGSFEPETYVFREGGNYGGPRVDPTMDKLTFADISRVIAEPLAAQNYVPSLDPSKTKLLIVVFWGVTIVPNDVMPLGTRASDMMQDKANNLTRTTIGKFNAQGDAEEIQNNLEDAEAFSYVEAIRDGQIDAQSANILGYTEEILRLSRAPADFLNATANDARLGTLKDEVESDRYYVVLLAYDYQLGRKFRMHRLLWETRYSIPEPGNDFEKAFPMMSLIAGKYFGQTSQGLIHYNLGNPNVEVGEPKSLGTVPEK